MFQGWRISLWRATGEMLGMSRAAINKHMVIREWGLDVYGPRGYSLPAPIQLPMRKRYYVIYPLGR